jgi:hypothetical protein
VLSEQGGMGVMVYGALGRRGVYETQALAETFAPLDLAPKERLAIGKRLFKELPATNWLKRNPFIRDHLDGGDAGFYDLLLHARDRAFDVFQFESLIATAMLRIVTYIQPALYEPASYLTDPALIKAVSDLPRAQRAGMAERLAGNITKHIAYLAPSCRSENITATPNNSKAIPILGDANGSVLSEAARRGRIITKYLGTELSCPMPRLAPAILRRIDNETSIEAIYQDIAKVDSSLSRKVFNEAFLQTFEGLNGLNLMWLKVRAV